MKELLVALVGLIKDAPPPIQIGILIFLCFFGVAHFRYHLARYRSIYDKTKLQIEKIESYIQGEPALSPLLQRILKAEREDQVFRHVFGFSLSPAMQEALLPVVTAKDSPAHWSVIKDARQYLRLDEHGISVHIPLFDRFEHYWKMASATLLLCLAALCLYYTKHANTAAEVYALLSAIAIAFLVSFLLFTSQFGYWTAVRIDQWLKKERKRSESSLPQ
jgi:hypothetical protein